MNAADSFCFLPFRIPLKKFRSIRRELTDSGKRVQELLADKHSLKYNFGFPPSNNPTPETLKNYLDVSVSIQSADLATFTSSLLPNALFTTSATVADSQQRSCCAVAASAFCKSSQLNGKLGQSVRLSKAQPTLHF